MPLKYPNEWKFSEPGIEVPETAHREFMTLVRLITEGSGRSKEIYEDFKSAFGVRSVSTSEGWAEADLENAMSGARQNAARYIAAFYLGIEKTKEQKVPIPQAADINKILVAHDVPLRIEGQSLVLASGDVTLNNSEEVNKGVDSSYKREELIGSGGFGDVYRVTRKTRFGEYDFAMKVFHPSAFVTNKEKAEARFQREMQALRKLQHRGIIQFLEAGVDQEQKPYILMPFIKGPNLQEALSGADSGRVIRTFVEILDAVEFAHSQNIIHRDLKPSNILIRLSDGQPIILDFGCAYLMDDLDETLTTKLIGTSPYVPDEVFRNPSERSFSQDVFACGVLLYEIITGSRPDPSDYERIDESCDDYLGLDDLIQRAIASKNKRIATAGELRDQLTSFIPD